MLHWASHIKSAKIILNRENQAKVKYPKTIATIQLRRASCRRYFLFRAVPILPAWFLCMLRLFEGRDTERWSALTSFFSIFPVSCAGKPLSSFLPLETSHFSFPRHGDAVDLPMGLCSVVLGYISELSVVEGSFVDTVPL